MSELSAISTAANIATSLLGRVNPILGLASGQLSVPASMAQLMDDIATGNLSDTEMYILGLGDMPASSSALTLTARTLGLLALGGIAAGAATAGLASGLALGFGLAAALANPTVRDILTDPNFWESIQKGYDDPSKIPDIINDYFTSAQKFRLVFDPLTLDLDGDGLETTGIDPNAPILFDHNADGIKTGTGWVSADDGMLVLDRNGNGSIDTGQELFGDSTVKSNGQLALDGFDALADLDSNADGQISSADAQFAGLRVWRDLNQDGISQGGELFTLDSLGIASIGTAKTANSQTLANGNQIADLGTYTRTDGSTGTSGDMSGRVAAQQRGTHRPTPCGCNLAADTFHREFTSTLDTTAVAALPDMQACPERSRRGSGVWGQREAANEGTWKKVAQ